MDWYKEKSQLNLLFKTIWKSNITVSRILLQINSVVMGRVYQNPKTRRVLGDFFKPEATRTRTFQKFIYPKIPEPEIFEFLDTRRYPNPKFKPAGTRRVKKPKKSALNFGPKLTLKSPRYCSKELWCCVTCVACVY